MAKEKKVKDPEKKKRRRKRARRVLCIILCVILVFVGVSVAVTLIGDNANTKKAQSFAPVAVEDRLEPEKDADGNWSFTTDRPFKILQLTDVHIGGGWMSLKKDAMALNAVAAMVTAEKPDLVVVTGDVSYPVPFQAGTFNNKLGAKIFTALMEQLGVYWTLAFGNHDTEAYSYFSREALSEFYSDESLTHCLYQPGPDDVDGYGNQIIRIRNSQGFITQTLYLFDSHSYTDNDYFGILWKYDDIHENQIAWYKDAVQKTKAANIALAKEKKLPAKSIVKERSLAFFHIPIEEQRTAWNAYAANGYKDTADAKFIYGTAGETGKVVYCGMHGNDLFETMLELGDTQGVFFGHDHDNNFSFDYKGIRLTYGMSVDYLAYPGIYKRGAQRGCTVITVMPDGTFDYHAENYYQAKYISMYEKEQVTMQEVTYAQGE